jgi:phosphoribosylamine---glycine ligase
MLRIKSDFVDLLEGVAENNLDERTIEIDQRNAVTVMLVSGGYPGNYEKGKTIEGIENVDGSFVFHAGTSFRNDKVATAGGRVIAISSYGASMNEALTISYKNAEEIDYEGKYYRKDLGFDL